MMPKVVKEVRRYDEAYDVVLNDDGTLIKRPVDAAAPKPVATKQPEPKPQTPDASA